MEPTDLELWEKTAEFHGHICPGLSIGYKAALYAKELLDLSFQDSNVAVCISETDKCPIDAIKAAFGCNEEKNSLFVNLTGDMAFSLLNRATGKSVRLVYKGLNAEGLDRNEMQKAIINASHYELFAVEAVPESYSFS
ncbi:MAG: formylmethanofuran dehydrogenase subunit E family protein [Eubacteriaceae bacterium]|nr:formylmethanofuran dehydrogenase subunit E family protein [Eubacteriaceae bacterium]